MEGCKVVSFVMGRMIYDRRQEDDIFITLSMVGECSQPFDGVRMKIPFVDMVKAIRVNAPSCPVLHLVLCSVSNMLSYH